LEGRPHEFNDEPTSGGGRQGRVGVALDEVVPVEWGAQQSAEAIVLTDHDGMRTLPTLPGRPR
jgi:hypothetical protein